MITWGLDTSHWEGTSLPIISSIIGKTGKINNQLLTTVHFETAYVSGCRFALIKCTDGIDAVDPVWDDSKRKALDAKLSVFPFHFYEEQNALEQSDWFISTMNGLYGGVPVVDYEVTPKNKQYVLNSLVSIGLNLCVEYHLTPMLYTSPYYLSLFGTLNLEPLLVYNLWLAWWNPGFITNCYPWAGYLARQWTNKGKLPGIKAAIDLDYMLDDPLKIVEYSKI